MLAIFKAHAAVAAKAEMVLTRYTQAALKRQYRPWGDGSTGSLQILLQAILIAAGMVAHYRHVTQQAPCNWS
jgi:hypothetical protein